MEIKHGIELPKKISPGRPPGKGVNLDLLKSLKDGDTVWDVSKKKMRSIIVSANLAGIRLTVRAIPNTKRYAFKINKAEDTPYQADGEEAGG
jgi:hypothetical protein